MKLDLRRCLEIWRQNKCNENSSGWYCKICKRRERINLSNLKFPLQSPCKEDHRIELGFEEMSRNMEAEQV